MFPPTTLFYAKFAEVLVSLQKEIGDAKIKMEADERDRKTAEEYHQLQVELYNKGTK